MEADDHRWTRWTRRISTVNLHKRRLQIRMWTDRFSRKRCNNNLRAGPTIVLWQGSETQEEVSKTLHLEALHDGMDTWRFLRATITTVSAAALEGGGCFADEDGFKYLVRYTFGKVQYR